MSSYPILMYHALTAGTSGERYVLPVSTFRAHVRLLAAQHRRGISLSELSRPGGWTEGAVVLSFDDGHASNFELALPVLEEFGFTATFFITTSRVGTGREWLTWEQIGQMKDRGMDLQAHGHTHRFLDGLSEAEQDCELLLPRELFHARLTHEVHHFSFPGGRYNRYSLRRAPQCGYRTLSSSVPGLNPVTGRGANGLLKRVVIHQGISEQVFRRIISRDRRYLARERARYVLKRSLRTALGNRIYHLAWRRLNVQAGDGHG